MDIQCVNVHTTNEQFLIHYTACTGKLEMCGGVYSLPTTRLLTVLAVKYSINWNEAACEVCGAVGHSVFFFPPTFCPDMT